MVDRTLPRWVLLGAPRSGTTTIARWLGSHPGGYVPPEKEVAFFTAHWDRGLDWYASRYAAGAGLVGGDASPAYLYRPQAVDRILATLPDARLVVVLRSPPERTWSDYQAFRAAGVEGRRWERVLRDEEERPGDPSYRGGLGYLHLSAYAPHLRRLLELAGRDRVLVLTTEDLRDRPLATFASLCRHVGLPVLETPPPLAASNAGRAARSYRLQRALQLSRAYALPGRVARRVSRWNLDGPPLPALDPVPRATLHRLLDPYTEQLGALGVDVPPSWTARHDRLTVST